MCLGGTLSGYSNAAATSTGECLGRYNGPDLNAGVFGSADCVSAWTASSSGTSFYTPVSGHADADALCRTCDGLCTHLLDHGADGMNWRGCSGPPVAGGDSGANVRLYTGCEAAYVFDAFSGLQLLKLTPSDSSTDDRFGAPHAFLMPACRSTAQQPCTALRRIFGINRRQYDRGGRSDG